MLASVINAHFFGSTSKRGDLSAVKGIPAGDPLAKAAELAQAVVLCYESPGRPKRPRVLVCRKIVKKI
jgi:hypothetical protein